MVFWHGCCSGVYGHLANLVLVGCAAGTPIPDHTTQHIFAGHRWLVNTQFGRASVDRRVSHSGFVQRTDLVQALAPLGQLIQSDDSAKETGLWSCFPPRVGMRDPAQPGCECAQYRLLINYVPDGEAYVKTRSSVRFRPLRIPSESLQHALPSRPGWSGIRASHGADPKPGPETVRGR